MSKEIEYIWGLQRVAHHQGKFIQEGSKIIKSQSSHSTRSEAKGVPAEIEGAMVSHPSKSSSSAPSTCDSKEAWDHTVDAQQPGSKPVTKCVDGLACSQHLNREAGDSHVEVATAGKESGAHSRIITTQQDVVHGGICACSSQLGVDCQVPKGLSFHVTEARCAQLGGKVHNAASREVPQDAAESDQRRGPGNTSSTERTDALPGQTAETPGKTDERTNEQLKATIRPRDPDPCEPHERLDDHAKTQACHEPEVLQPEHEEMDERDKQESQESQEEARERIGQEGEESEEDQVILSDREDDDSMCEQDRCMQDAKMTEEDTHIGEEEEGRTDSLADTASEEAFQHERNEQAKELLEENQLGEAWQARGKEEPNERQGQIYDGEEQCCQEDLKQFRVADLGPVYVSEDKHEREGATGIPHEQDDNHVAPGRECAEELERSKPNAAWLPDEIFRAQTPRVLRINAPDSTGMQTPWVTLQNNELSLPPKVLAGAVPRAVASDVSAMPSPKARALLSTRHWRGCGILPKHNPPSSPILPRPEGTEWQAKPCGLGPEMYSIGTPPVPMWDPFFKLSTGLNSQSRQTAPCVRPSEHVLRVRWERT